MNNQRRAALKRTKDALQSLIAAIPLSDFEVLANELEEIIGEEQEYLDSFPESFRNSDTADETQERITNLEVALAEVQEFIDLLSDLQTTSEGEWLTAL